MKKHTYIALILIVLCFILPSAVHAASLRQKMTSAIGGRVVPSPLQATITCAAAYGPFFMLPYNFAIPGPFFIRTTTNGTPLMGGHVLANYTPNATTCVNSQSGAPFPAFELKEYGVSR
jgi:hypothetical protein